MTQHIFWLIDMRDYFSGRFFTFPENVTEKPQWGDLIKYCLYVI